jgi:hypothetical protein
MPHEVRAPEHAIEPNRRSELRTLSNDFHKHATDILSGISVASDKMKGGPELAQIQLRAEFVSRSAGDYSLDLHRYWSFAGRVANDEYLGSFGGSAQHLQGLNDYFSKVDRQLDKPLAAWEKATSPFADHYDADSVKEAASRLLDTLKSVDNYLAARFDGITKLADKKSQKEGGFEIRLRLGVGALSEQIGQRLAALGAGDTVDRVSMSSQTQQLLERSGKDPALEAFTKESVMVQGRLDALKADPMKKMGEMRARQLEIVEERVSKTKETAVLDEENLRLDRALYSLQKELDAVNKPIRDQRKIGEARDRLGELRKTLTRKLSPEERTSAKEEYKNFAATLARLEEPFLALAAQAADQEIQDIKYKGEAYKQGLENARGAFAEAKNSSDYWNGLKTELLSTVEVAGGKDLRNLVNNSFVADLAGQLKAWRNEQAEIRLDPAKLQDRAAKLLETVNAYSLRATTALKNLDPGLAAPVQDRLNCGLAALRESVTKELKFLFDHGAFSGGA